MAAFLPITDFQFMFYGFATFAATVGYACAKRRPSIHQHTAPAVDNRVSSQASDTSEDSSSDERASSDAEPMSRKRKSVDDHDSSARRPRKRSRSPSIEADRSKTAVVMDESNSPSPVPCNDVEVAKLDGEEITIKQGSNIPTVNGHVNGCIQSTEQSRCPSVEANSSKSSPQTAVVMDKPNASSLAPPNDVEDAKLDDEESTIKQRSNTPAVNDHVNGFKQSTEDVNKVVNLPRTLVTPPPSPSPPTRARGFAAFAGTGSPFMASSFTPHGTTASPIPQRPVWCGNGNTIADQLSPGFANSQAVDSAAAAEGPINDKPPVENFTGSNAGEAALAATETPAKATVAHLTGEEDEMIKSELKGIKLFVKRGAKGFTGGMPGHLKLLARSGGDEERLLFRREPLWKVSMNVRVRPTVRCTFDEEDNVLRIILKEAVEVTLEYGDEAAEPKPQELVVYALKRGRVPKKDFKEFAEALLENPLFKSSTLNEPTAVVS